MSEMKKNGFTLTELLVSIVLISVIMVFLVKLLIQVSYEKSNELYDTANSINRSEIINKVEKDFFITPLKSLSCSKNDKKLVIEFKNVDNKISKLEIAKFELETYITYDSIIDSKTEKWKLEKNNPDTFINIENVKYKLIVSQDSSISNKQYYALQINIPVIVDNNKIIDNSDSVLDDLVFNFYGEGVDYNFPNLDKLNCD